MTAQTSTTLPAIKVASASKLAISELLEQRASVAATVERAFVSTFRREHPFKAALMREDTILARLPEGMKIIPEQYRQHDEAVLRAVQDLSLAAVATNPEFTVEMTADDFRLVSKHYPKEKP